MKKKIIMKENQFVGSRREITFINYKKDVNESCEYLKVKNKSLK